jgi:hypothetical protein
VPRSACNIGFLYNSFTSLDVKKVASWKRLTNYRYTVYRYSGGRFLATNLFFFSEKLKGKLSPHLFVGTHARPVSIERASRRVRIGGKRRDKKNDLYLQVRVSCQSQCTSRSNYAQRKWHILRPIDWPLFARLSRLRELLPPCVV